MASMVVRNIPDDVFERFKQQAKAEGKSAEQLAREAIEGKAKPSRDEILRRMDELRARSKPVPGFDVLEEIRRGREERGERLGSSKGDTAE